MRAVVRSVAAGLTLAAVSCSFDTASGSSERNKDRQGIGTAEDDAEAKSGAGSSDGANDPSSECTSAADCPEAALYDCIGRRCVLKRWSSGSIWFASGAGIISSPNFRARLTVGVRQPTGKTKSAKYTVSLGPDGRRRF